MNSENQNLILNVSQSQCYGVDLNRNVGVEGYGIGASDNQCEITYMGPEKNSEPETLALTKAIYKRRENVRAYFTLHSFGKFTIQRK